MRPQLDPGPALAAVVSSCPSWRTTTRALARRPRSLPWPRIHRLPTISRRPPPNSRSLVQAQLPTRRSSGLARRHPPPRSPMWAPVLPLLLRPPRPLALLGPLRRCQPQLRRRSPRPGLCRRSPSGLRSRHCSASRPPACQPRALLWPRPPSPRPRPPSSFRPGRRSCIPCSALRASQLSLRLLHHPSRLPLPSRRRPSMVWPRAATQCPWERLRPRGSAWVNHEGINKTPLFILEHSIMRVAPAHHWTLVGFACSYIDR